MTPADLMRLRAKAAEKPLPPIWKPVRAGDVLEGEILHTRTARTETGEHAMAVIRQWGGRVVGVWFSDWLRHKAGEANAANGFFIRLEYLGKQRYQGRKAFDLYDVTFLPPEPEPEPKPGDPE